MDEFKCFYCGENLKWNSTVMASDIYGEYFEDTVAKINYFTCPKCGRDYEIFDPTEEDRDTYYSTYWDDKQ